MTSGNKEESKNPQQVALEKTAGPSKNDILHTDIYAANLTLLQN